MYFESIHSLFFIFIHPFSTVPAFIPTASNVSGIGPTLETSKQAFSLAISPVATTCALAKEPTKTVSNCLPRG